LAAATSLVWPLEKSLLLDGCFPSRDLRLGSLLESLRSLALSAAKRSNRSRIDL
jgi:hypothetical protein